MHESKSLRRSRRILALLVALLPLAAVAPTPASAQVQQGVGMAITPIFPAMVVVGQAGAPASLLIANNSAGVGPVTLTSITLNPSCGDPFFSCSDPDLGVLLLSPSAVGTAGACDGRAFTVQPPDANGRSSFVPTTPVILQPPGQANDDCTITFTFSTLKAPTKDADPSAGLQTRQFATISGTALTLLLQTLFGNGAGTSITTIERAQPAINTHVTAERIGLGSSISDIANLSGGVNPTGTITFRLHGPGDELCEGTPVFTTTRNVIGNGDHVSAPFTPTQTGGYRWVADYSGDLNNLPVAQTSCADVLEAFIVSQLPPPTTTAPPGPTTPTTIGVGILGTAPPGGPITLGTPLVRTGSNALALSALALLLVAIGAHLIVEARRRRTG